jgi:hypothetical protein
LIVNTNVAIESQPAAFVNVWVYVPEVVYVVPFVQVYELQAVTGVEEAELLLIVKFNVIIESQPAAFVNVCVYVPEVVYV